MGEPETVIRVENVSKKYVLSHRQERARYVALRDVLADKARGLGRRLLGRNGTATCDTREEFWALRDVSFEVKHGEVVGIIGRNGAGKSTLLKILSRITEPTTGRIEIDGRVASLLEVGTGFHPELTGRENVFLNGSILGMTRAEIRRKFDEIVAFAEVEKFLDTPVKRYSSGMYMRLAFAIAAHLDPEILVVDEVLAVGDAEFQKKCLGKMGEVSKAGRTVLFVSHNMAAVQALTSRCILLDAGRLDTFATTDAVVEVYQMKAGSQIGQHNRMTGKPAHLIERIELKADGICTETVCMGASLSVELTYNHAGPPEEVMAGIGIDSYSGSRIVSMNSLYDAGKYFTFSGRGKLVCDLGRLPLNPSIYRFKLAIVSAKGAVLEEIADAMSFEVVGADVHKQGFATQVQQGVFFWLGSWTDGARPAAAETTAS